MASTPKLQLFDVDKWGQALVTVGISSSGNKGGAVYLAPKTGNIRYIGFSLSASSVAGTLEGRLETVNSSGLPSGTLQGTNTNNATITSPSANTFTWFQFTADAAVTQGDLIAATVGYVATASVTMNYGMNRNTAQLPYACLFSASAWTSAQQAPCICLKYDDGEIIDGGLPCNQLIAPAFKSSTNPNERAMVFTPPFSCTMNGVKFLGQPDSRSTTFTVGVYSGTSTTPIQTFSVPINGASSLFNENIYTIPFRPTISLTGGTAYRIGILATSANNINMYSMTFPSTAERDMVMGPATSDTRNGGAWIGENTTRSEFICPQLDTVTTSGGGSSLAPFSRIFTGF